jgi:hypothetical protein
MVSKDEVIEVMLEKAHEDQARLLEEGVIEEATPEEKIKKLEADKFSEVQTAFMKIKYGGVLNALGGRSRSRKLDAAYRKLSEAYSQYGFYVMHYDTTKDWIKYWSRIADAAVDVQVEFPKAKNAQKDALKGPDVDLGFSAPQKKLFANFEKQLANIRIAAEFMEKHYERKKQRGESVEEPENTMKALIEKKRSKFVPNKEQLDALKRWAKKHGKDWKKKLQVAWMNSNYGYDFEGSGYLQQVRNQGGPSWLSKFDLKEDVSEGKKDSEGKLRIPPEAAAARAADEAFDKALRKQYGNEVMGEIRIIKKGENSWVAQIVKPRGVAFKDHAAGESGHAALAKMAKDWAKTGFME